MKAVIFARTGCLCDEGSSSILEQLSTLREYARKQNLEVVKEFSTIGSTLSNEGKKSFNSLISYLKKNNDVKALVITSPNRLTRNYEDMRLLDNFQFSDGKQLHIVETRTIISNKGQVMDINLWELYKIYGKLVFTRLEKEARTRKKRSKVNFMKGASNAKKS